MIFEKATLGTWGCSSAGRAPALQAGGHGFEPHHLHQPAVPVPKHGTMERTGKPNEERSVAQVVRAHA